jgi:hypothetical protein
VAGKEGTCTGVGEAVIAGLGGERVGGGVCGGGEISSLNLLY